MKKHVVVSILLMVLLLSAAGALVAWMIATRAEPKEATPRRSVPIVLAPPVEPNEDYRVRITGFGSARPRVRLRIAPQVAGEVVARAAEFLSGRFVRKGQVLFQVDKTDYALARDAADRQIDLLNVQLQRLATEEANLTASRRIEQRRVELAREQIDKVRRLLTRGAATQQDVDNAEEAALLRDSQLQTVLNQIALIEPQRRQLQAELEVAKVRLAQAQTDLSRTEVLSPVTGRVLDCSVEAGERVAVGQTCGEIYGTEVMDVPVPIPASDLAWLGWSPDANAPRDPVPATVVWERGEGRPIRWRGAVGRVEAGLAAQTRTASVVVEVRNDRRAPDQPALDLNMFCTVTILGRALPKAYLLPREAILPDQSVYVVNSGRLRKRPVRIARLTGERAMLLPGGGVEAGDRVVLRYVPKPVEGMQVRVVDRLPAPLAPAAGPATAPAAPGP